MRKQCWIVSLKITQECGENMKADEIREWVEAHFEGCDFGSVEALSAFNHSENQTDTK